MRSVICTFDLAGGPIPPLHDRHVVWLRSFFALAVGWRGLDTARNTVFGPVLSPSLFFIRRKQSVRRTRVLHHPSCVCVCVTSLPFLRFASTTSSWMSISFRVGSISLAAGGGFIDVRAVSSLWPMLCGPRLVVVGSVSVCWICRRPSVGVPIWHGRIFPCR